MVASEFDRWQLQHGPCDVDICCDTNGDNNQLVASKKFWHNFFAKDPKGLYLWINPPLQPLWHGLSLYAYTPVENKLITLGLRLSYQTTLWDWSKTSWNECRCAYLNEIHRYPKGSRLFLDAAGVVRPTKWAVVIFQTINTEKLPSADVSITPPLVCQTYQKLATRKNRLLPCVQCSAQSHVDCMKTIGERFICGACTRPLSKRITSKPLGNHNLLKTHSYQGSRHPVPGVQDWVALTDQPPLDGGETRNPRARPFRLIGQWLWRDRRRGTAVCSPRQSPCQESAPAGVSRFSRCRSHGNRENLRTRSKTLMVAWDAG